MLMRLSSGADRDAVEAMILGRCAWMEERRLPSWRGAAGDLAGQCGGPGGDVWVLERDGAIVGTTTLQRQGPPYGWTAQEQAEPALYLSTTVTDPAHRGERLGTLIAWWAADRAAGMGVSWVRRDCLWPELAAYYQAQGYGLVREATRGRHRHHMLARRAAPVPEVAEWLRTGTRPTWCPG